MPYRTRYEMRGVDGRPLYRGEVINGRRWAPASRIGWVRAFLGALGALVLLLLFGWPWWAALLLAGFYGQFVRTHLARQYSRNVYAGWPQAQGAPVDPPDDVTAPAPRTKADDVRLAVEAGLPYLDYESGEIWPVHRSQEWLREQETHKLLDSTMADLDAAKIGRLSTPGDKKWIDTLARAPWAPYPDEIDVTLPSGRHLWGSQVNRLIETRQWEIAQERQQRRIAQEQRQRRQAAQQERRAPEVIHRDMAALRRDVGKGKISASTGSSLMRSLEQELAEAAPQGIEMWHSGWAGERCPRCNGSDGHDHRC